MKNKLLKKGLAILSVAIMCFSMTGSYAQAAETEVPDPAPISNSGGMAITPYKSVLITCYREFGLLLQKRRWNSSYGRWEDDYWITIGYRVFD